MEVNAVFAVSSVILLLFDLGALADEIDFDAAEEECLAKTGVSKGSVIEAKLDNVVPADDPKYKKFLGCCWEKYGYLSEQGDVAWEKIEEVLNGQLLDEHVVSSLARKCDAIKGETAGDTAALVLECLDDNVPSLHNLHAYHAGHNRD